MRVTVIVSECFDIIAAFSFDFFPPLVCISMVVTILGLPFVLLMVSPVHQQ